MFQNLCYDQITCQKGPFISMTSFATKEVVGSEDVKKKELWISWFWAKFHKTEFRSVFGSTAKRCMAIQLQINVHV